MIQPRIQSQSESYCCDFHAIVNWILKLIQNTNTITASSPTVSNVLCYEYNFPSLMNSVSLPLASLLVIVHYTFTKHQNRHVNNTIRYNHWLNAKPEVFVVFLITYCKNRFNPYQLSCKRNFSWNNWFLNLT